MHHPEKKIAHTTAFVTTSCGALAGTRNNSMGPSLWIDPTTHRITSGRSSTELHFAFICMDACMNTYIYARVYESICKYSHYSMLLLHWGLVKTLFSFSHSSYPFLTLHPHLLSILHLIRLFFITLNRCPKEQKDCVLIPIPGECCPRLECMFHKPVHKD